MEGIVAKRTLRKSFYEKNLNVKENFIDAETNGIYSTSKTRRKQKEIEKGKLEKIKGRIIYKLSIQAITVAGIVAFVICINAFNIDIVKNSDAVKRLKTKINTNYSFGEILENTKAVSKKIYKVLTPIIPKKIEEQAIEIYKKISEKISNKSINVYSEDVSIYEENNNNQENKNQEEQNNISIKKEFLNNIGSGIDSSQEEISINSSISSEEQVVECIKETGIKFVKPTVGVITSGFGAREVIFEGIDSYHTGTDIAANVGTSVYSSITGKVIKAQYNKYNGNYIEVQNDDIVTKYCHLNNILVKENEEVYAGQEIGKMGSTGLSTGPHLHFEIVFKGVKINPELVLAL